MNHRKILTNAAGNPVSDNRRSLTAGPRGPVLLQDTHLLEKLAHFNRERIPARVAFAKGVGAYGIFTVTNDISSLTKAKLFAKVGNQVEVFARLSLMNAEPGTADTVRDVRGFAVKFYTDDGNWDLVGSHFPVFFLRDPMAYVDLMHAMRRDPRSHLVNPALFWDICSHFPEAIHAIVMLFSERGIPKSYRHLHGYGVHTYSMINAAGERIWVRFHWLSQQGVECLTPKESTQRAGEDPDFAARDFYEKIEEEEFPKWKLHIQIMTEEQAETCPVNPFDPTRVWRHGTHPLREVGIFELKRNPDNYFAHVEQAAFAPSNIVPGIGFSPDRILQARLFAYPDAQRYRLGVNHHLLDVNQTKDGTARTYHRDGFMRLDENGASAVHFEPNHFDGPKPTGERSEPGLAIIGETGRFPETSSDDYTQPGLLIRLMTPEQRKQLIENLAESLNYADRTIKVQVLSHFYRADAEMAKLLTQRVEIEVELVEHVAKSGEPTA